VLFQFGSDYRAAFETANKRARKHHERQGQERRPILLLPAPTRVPRPAAARPETPALISPKFISEAEKKVIMGEIRRPPAPTSLNPKLEAALDGWKRAAEGQGLFGSGQ
jgi:hypothetical protein